MELQELQTVLQRWELDIAVSQNRDLCSLHTKPHIKHSVSFIKHKVSDSLKVCSFLFHMINQTTL